MSLEVVRDHGKPGKEGSALDQKKITYKNLHITSHLMARDLTLFSKIMNKESCLLSLLLVNIALEVPSSVIKEEKAMRGI